MYNKKQLKVENASGHKKKNPNMKKGTHQNIQSSVNDMFMRNQTMFGPSGKRRYLPMEQGGDPDELYNMKRAIELGYQADENGHWPSVDSENGMWLKSKAHPTAWKEYMYGQLNADLAKNYDVRANPEGPFGENQLQHVPKKQQGGWLDQYDDGGSIVNYLASKGQDYSKKGRETLAKKMGVKDYDFSAEKNLELLDKLKSVGRVKPMKEQQLPEVTITPWTKDINAYEKGNPKQAFIDSKKREYLNASGIRGLNKLAGLSSDNFPANKELEYIKEYEYKKNNKLAPKIIASYGNPKDRSTWVEKLTPQEYEIVKNSDYRFDLEPNAFETTYAALNKMVSPMPNRYVQPTKGLTQNEMQNIGALNSFDFLNVPGQALGSVMRSPNLPGNPNNAYANNSMMKGLQGYHDPHRLEGEEILANPLNWTMGYDAALMLGQAPKVAAAVSNTVKNMPKTSKDIIYKVADLALDNPLGEKLVNKMADKRLPQYVPDTPTPQTLLPGDAEKIKELSTFVNKHEEIIKDARLNQLRAQGYSLKDARAIRDYETAKFLGEYDFGNIPQKTVEKITKKTSKEMAEEYANTANFKEPTPKEGTNFTIKPDPSLHGKIYKTVDKLKKARVLREEVEAALNPIPNPTPFQKFYIEKIIKKAFKNKYKMDIPTVDDFILAEQNQLIPTIESIDRANPRQDLFNASKRGKEIPKGVPFMGGASLSDNSFPIALKLTEKAIKEGKATPFFMAHGPMNNWGHLAQYANDPELMLRNANEAIKDFNTNQTKVKLPYAYLKNDVVHYPRLGLKNHKKGGSVDWLSQFEKGGSTNWLDNY